MKFPFIVFLVSVACAVTNTIAAQAIVRGKVTAAQNEEPLAGVYVLYGNNQGTLTDDDGSFEITLPPGKDILTFRSIGYKDVTREITIQAGKDVYLEIPLETELLEIGQIVISANRSEQKISELTVSMEVLKPADFSSSHITDTKELINKTPGIEVLDGQASIRGGTGFSYGVGSRVLALIDGLPFATPDAGNIKWQFLPLENLSQVEIIKGASSVLYGSNALNGVINFRTAAAGEKPVTRFFAETGIFGKPRNEDWVWWDSPRMSSAVSFSHLRRSGNNDLGIGMNITRTNSYRRYNDETLGRINLRLRHFSQKTQGLEYGLNLNSGYTNKTDFILWENATTGALTQNPENTAELKGSFIALDPFLGFSHGNTRHDLKFRLQASDNRFPVRTQNNSTAYSAYGEYQAGFNLGRDFSVIAGLSGNYINIVSSFYGNHNGLNLAGFTQAETRILQRLKLVAGVRLEYNSLDGIRDRLVPIFRTGINWQVAEYTFIRGSFGQGYRYPSVAEKYASTTLGSVRIIPSPEINPETGWSSEIGIKQGILLGNITGQADAAVFIARNNDMIEYIFGLYPDEVTGVFDFGFKSTNVEQSRITGYEIEFMMSRNTGGVRINAGGGYTFIHPVEINPVTKESKDKYLKYRRKHSLKIAVSAGYHKFEAGLDMYYRSAILEIDDVFTGELTRESILPGFYDYWLANNTGYILLDGNLGYNISEHFSLSFAVKNLTNKEYMGRPGDIQPHRYFSLRFSGKF